MFGNLGEMAGMLKKAKEIQKNIQTMKESMADSEFTACVEDTITVIVSGDFRVKAVELTPAATAHEDLPGLIVQTVNEALSRAKVAAAEQMREATGGLNIPGLF